MASGIIDFSRREAGRYTVRALSPRVARGSPCSRGLLLAVVATVVGVVVPTAIYA